MRKPDWLTFKVAVAFCSALLAYALWFNGLGAATWTLLRAMTESPQNFTTGAFVLVVFWLVLRMVKVVLLPGHYRVGATGPAIGPAHVAGSAITSAIPDEMRREFAEHEAAHVVACVARSVDVSKVTVRRNYPPPGASLGGRVESTTPLNLDTPGMAPPEKWFDQMVILLAGRAYDDLHDRTPFGSISDYDQSHAIAAMLHRYRTMPDATAEALFDRAADEAVALVTTYQDLIAVIGRQIYAATTDTDTVPDSELRRILDAAAAVVSGR